MRSIDISQLKNSVVIHFDTEYARINAYTLASTLVSLADAAKAANVALNSDLEIEIAIEALGPGSSRALIRAIYSSEQNHFAKRAVPGVVLGVLGNYMYERYFAVDDKVIVDVKTDEAVLLKGQDRIVIPRHVYDATRTAEKNPHFVKAMSRTFEAMAADDEVNGFGLVSSMDSPPPDIIIPKTTLQQMATNVPKDPYARVIYDQVDLQVIKATLDKSKDKWDFMWRGIRISAAVVHQNFYVNYFAHEITVATGDILQARLAIKQTKNPQTGIYSNIGYEVVEVYGHIPRFKQMPFVPGDSEGISDVQEASQDHQ